LFKKELIFIFHLFQY